MQLVADPRCGGKTAEPPGAYRQIVKEKARGKARINAKVEAKTKKKRKGRPRRQFLKPLFNPGLGYQLWSFR
jgi:hypothetical protein